MHMTAEIHLKRGKPIQRGEGFVMLFLEAPKGYLRAEGGSHVAVVRYDRKEGRTAYEANGSYVYQVLSREDFYETHHGTGTPETRDALRRVGEQPRGGKVIVVILARAGEG